MFQKYIYISTPARLHDVDDSTLPRPHQTPHRSSRVTDVAFVSVASFLIIISEAVTCDSPVKLEASTVRRTSRYLDSVRPSRPQPHSLLDLDPLFLHHLSSPASACTQSQVSVAHRLQRATSAVMLRQVNPSSRFGFDSCPSSSHHLNLFTFTPCQQVDDSTSLPSPPLQRSNKHFPNETNIRSHAPHHTPFEMLTCIVIPQ